MKVIEKMTGLRLLEEITKEDVLNVTGSMFDTMLDYVDNSNNELEKLQQALNEIETILKQPMPNEFALCKALDEIEIIVNKAKGN